MLRLLALLAALAAAPTAGASSLWGSCDRWDRFRSGCQITSGHKCSDHLSPGPAGATIEIVLGNLPASKAGRPVHLQWFAPREAKGYNPVEGVHKWMVYRRLRFAYPKYTDSDFNGGNVRVNETGHAVLRFEAPSTYVMCYNKIRYPHVHLRLCTGEAYLINRAETIDFRLEGPKVRACGFGGATHKYTIHSFRNIGQIPAAIGKGPITTKTVDATSLRRTTSTTTSSTSTTTTPVADDSYDWDALEFSPVYQCLLEEQVFDHFSSGCADKCPAHASLKHGQCVRKATNNRVEFSVSWALRVNCDEECWNAKTSRTRHNLRLATADHLDIPFQEVLKVVLRPKARRLEVGRSLTSTTILSDATLHISVNTSRQDDNTGSSLLRSLFADIEVASQLLGLDVHNVAVVDAAPESAGNLEPGEDSDEFAPLYSDIDNDGGVAPIGASPTDRLPTGVLIAGACAVVVLGALTVGVLWCRKRRLSGNPAGGAKDKHVVKGVMVDGEKVGAVHPEGKS